MTDLERYLTACHAVQTAVKFEQETLGLPDTFKHIRTGLNLRACDHAALVRLLIDKGIFTDVEYNKELADQAEREVARYESKYPGLKFT